MENPNKYDDRLYETRANQLTNAIYGLWEAGADLQDIEMIISDALQDVAGAPITVSIG